MKQMILIAALILTGCSERKLSATVTAVDGAAGQGCHVSEVNVPGGTTQAVICGDQMVPIGKSILGPINPCGRTAKNDEIFLRLSDGSIIAVFVSNSSALTTRLVSLEPGNYVTTDTANGVPNCSVVVDAHLNVTSSPTPTTGFALNPAGAQ